ncbi:MAG: glycosyltransferase, partial [Clostridia bacterium]|nr:glycosyltransferase [Clostridia bacterium]
MVAPVTVLLATYNGLPYLDEQIRSLKAQTVPFRCLVQDDGSDDGTREVLETLFQEDPRFFPAGEQGQHLGAAANFLSLLRQVSGPVALCDQDDIWEADKLEVLMQNLSQAEAHYGSG